MQDEKTVLYADAIASMQNSSAIQTKTEKTIPENYIVATHGPALAKVVREYPEILNLIGIYRLNCSHIGKE